MTPRNMIRITDCLVLPGGATFGEDLHVRITGFYRTARLDGVRRLLPCMPDHPDFSVLETYAQCGLFHRPWDVIFHHHAPWPTPLIEKELEDWAEKVSGKMRHATNLSEASYPELLRRFPDITAHDHARIALWLKDTRNRIRTSDRIPEVPPSPGKSTPA